MIKESTIHHKHSLGGGGGGGDTATAASGVPDISMSYFVVPAAALSAAYIPALTTAIVTKDPKTVPEGTVMAASDVRASFVSSAITDPPSHLQFLNNLSKDAASVKATHTGDSGGSTSITASIGVVVFLAIGALLSS